MREPSKIETLLAIASLFCSLNLDPCVKMSGNVDIYMPVVPPGTRRVFVTIVNETNIMVPQFRNGGVLNQLLHTTFTGVSSRSSILIEYENRKTGNRSIELELGNLAEDFNLGRYIALDNYCMVKVEFSYGRSKAKASVHTATSGANKLG